jgi:hypothetical protein
MASSSIRVDHFPLLSQHELIPAILSYFIRKVGLLKDFRHRMSALTMLLPANKAATMIVPEVSD